MKYIKIFLVILIVLFLLPYSTSQGQPKFFFGNLEIPVQYDPLIASYPKYRVDDRISRIAIIGSGPASDEIISALTKFFLEEKPDIKVIERGNLQAILGGKVIEFRTGLNPSDAQALSQMLQIDHILLFEEKESPYSDYKYGGRMYVRINLRIVSTLTGEVIYQTWNEYGGNIQNPPGSSSITVTPSVIHFYLERCYMMMYHYLRYALGKFSLGVIFVAGDTKVLEVMKNSLADRAGIRTGDKIIEINGIRVQTRSDYDAIGKNIKEDNERIYKIERQGRILQLSISLPTIPYSPKEEEKGNNSQNKKKERSTEIPL